MVSKRRNDNRDYRRKAARRQPRFRILIVCEGEVTERSYFKLFQHHVKNPRVHIELPDEPGVPLTVVRTAVRRREESEVDADREGDDNLRFDSVWAVFDVDDHPNLDQALALARTSRIEVAMSNPCFELWALLHFEEQTAHIERRLLVPQLRKHCPDYEKKLPFEKLVPNHEDAVQRARALWDGAARDQDPGRNPTTGVFHLTEIIRSR
jgi:hypothetical protein